MRRSWQYYQQCFRIGLLASTCVFGIAGDGSAELFPDGPEFQVNTNLPSGHESPSVAMNDSGQSVVIWQNNGQDGDGDGVFGQRYNSAGSPIGPEFQVNTVTNSPQNEADVAMDDAGNFVVVWQRFNFITDEGGIFGQRFANTGDPIGSEFQVSAQTTADQRTPAVAMDADGDFVVVWQDDSGVNTDDFGVLARRYNQNGSPVGSQFQVNTYLPGGQSHPDVAIDSVGDFVVVWDSWGQDGNGTGIFGQRFDSNGSPLGSEFQVNSWTSFNQEEPAVTIDGNSKFIVVWQSEEQDGDQSGIFGQRYHANGNPQGNDFQVNTFTTHSQFAPAVHANANGQFTVVWQGWAQDGDDFGVFGQLFSPSGSAVGDEFQVNTSTPHNQRYPGVSMDGEGNAIIVWESVQGDGGFSYGILGQRYLPNTSPVCDAATASPSFLYSNDNAFKIINVTNVSDPDGDSLTVTINEIYQDEQVKAWTDGYTSPDGQGIGTNAAEVRDEYTAFGNGRHYRINFTAEDGLGGSCMGMVFVRAGFKSKYDWDWIIYDSTEIPFKGISPQSLVTR